MYLLPSPSGEGLGVRISLTNLKNKKMRKKVFRILFAVAGIALTVGGCRKYDDSALWGELGAHKARLAALEAWQTTVNSNIGALQGLVAALQGQDYVTGVTPFTDPAPGGYLIGFAKSPVITIYHGANGADGVDGADGADGTNGADGVDGVDGADGADGAPGADGSTPQIGVEEYPADSGVYYWTVNGAWLLNNGEKIPVTGPKGDKGDKGDPGEDGEDGKDGENGQDGKDGEDGQPGQDGIDGQDGKDGENGQDGKDGEDGQPGQDGRDGEDGQNGVTPRLRINSATNYWEVCVTGVCTSESEWASLGVKATGAQGAQGPQGDAIFAAGGVDYTSSEDYVTFTLAGGATITLPKYRSVNIAFTAPAAFDNNVTRNISFTLTGEVAQIKALDVAKGWTVAASMNSGRSAGTLTITSPATWTSENVHDEAYVFVANAAGVTVMKPLLLQGTAASPARQTLQAAVTGRCVKPAATFSLSGTENGVSYRLYCDGAPVGAALAGTGSAAPFTGTFTAQGVYTARSVAAGRYLQVEMNGAHTLESANSPGAIGIITN
jgi:hypothetical protein